MAMFIVDNGGTLIIKGEAGSVLTFDGNFNVANVVSTGLSSGTLSSAAITAFSGANTKIELDYVDFKNFVSNRYHGGTHCGVISFHLNGGADPNHTIKLHHINIKDCYAGLPQNADPDEGNQDSQKWGRIINIQAGKWNIDMQHLKIFDCYVHEPSYSNPGIMGMGGIIRSQGNVGGTLTMDYCEIYNNKYYNRYTGALAGQGGALNWRSGNGSNDDTQVTITNSRFHHNQAKCGGAVATCATITMADVEIDHNTADEGGGVYFWTYNANQDSYDGRGFYAILGSGVDVHHNTATNYGGGAYVGIDPSDDVGFAPITSGTWNPEDHEVSPYFKVDIQEGATLYANKAPKGAGMAIRDAAPYCHKNMHVNTMNNTTNPAFGQWSGEYRREVIVSGGHIYENTAEGTTADTVAGAGIYIEKGKTSIADFEQDYLYPKLYYDIIDDDTVSIIETYTSGELYVHAQSGSIHGNLATNDSVPGFGGGMYIASLFDYTNDSCDVYSTLNVRIGDTIPGNSLEIYNNKAYTDGGGVYVMYDLEKGFNEGKVEVDSVTMGKAAMGNKALTRNGGGLCVMGGTVNINGGCIEYNTAAENGGGVYVNPPEDWSETNLVYRAKEDMITGDLTIHPAPSISYNEANHGGGIYVARGSLAGASPEIIGEYGLEDAANDSIHLRITRNKALDGNGGGVYVASGNISLAYTVIYGNEAQGSDDEQGRGGGVYLEGSSDEDDDVGIVMMTRCRILQNTAETNGGGLDCHSGYIIVMGGDISHNKATKGNGGGVYTHSGFIEVVPSEMVDDPENTGAVISYNTAGGNGGGLNNHIGRLDVRYANMHHNEAGHNYGSVGTQGGSGGGMFCEGPHTDPTGYTVRLIHTNLNYNKAHGSGGSGTNLTGRGGGLYVKYGSIFAEHCNILHNEAKINGGGLDNHEGELRVFGSYIEYNVANDSCGGGLYTNKGNLVIGPCDTYGYDVSKASRISNNTAGTHGGGVMNHEGDITIHGDQINHNTARKGKGGGVCLNTGDINMFGGQINHNHADDPTGGYGGGVYGGSGRFTIMERKENPIVEVLEIEFIMDTDFQVHYHVVDKGEALDYYELEHGVAYTMDENWASLDSIPFDYLNDSTMWYVEEEGCFRITVPELSEGTTYYVRAWAKYTDSVGVVYYDASPVVTATTLSFGGGDKKTNSKKTNGKGNMPRSIYPAFEENPFFQELTPLQQALLAITPEDDTTTRRSRKNRPASDEQPVKVPQINYNTATYGGGICLDKDKAEFVFEGTRDASADTIGQINYNYASEAGGGIYIGRERDNKYAQMQMMGRCEVNYNRVPASKHGGGIYLDGRLYVGDKDTDTVGTHGLKVDRNFAITKTQDEFYADTAAIHAGNAPAAYTKALNNVFLVRSDYEYDEHGDGTSSDNYNKNSVITLLSDVSGYVDENGNGTIDEGETTPITHLGFSVSHGFCPVIATSQRFGGDYEVHGGWAGAPAAGSEQWLYKLMNMSDAMTTGTGGSTQTAEHMSGAVFEDSKSYVAVHTRSDLRPFRAKYIYLWGCWTHPVVMEDPETIQPMKGSNTPDDPSSDPNWLGHYVIRNHGDYTAVDTTALEWEIYSPEGLAWFSSYVNGLNAFDQKTGNTDSDSDHHAWNVNQNPKANVKIMNDLDMIAYLWVPIGSVQKFSIDDLATEGGSLFVDSETKVKMKDPENPSGPEIDDPAYTINTHYYQGTFDGQGHIIKGIHGLYLTGIKKFGLFGYLAEGAVVKNTFVDDAFFISDNKAVDYSAGGIAGTMNAGTVFNSEARAEINVSYSGTQTAVGGLAGEMKAGSIHSSMAMPTMVGQNKGMPEPNPAFNAFQGYMGGLVGKTSGGTSIKNSFSNVEISLVETEEATVAAVADSRYIGGIVGHNQGRVENVYVRYQDENLLNLPTEYGWFAGKNDGTITICFAPDYMGSQGFLGSESGMGALTLRRNYGETNLHDEKYGFAHNDQVVAAYDNDATTYIPTTTGLSYDKNTHETSFNGLVDALNNWVASNSGHSKWTRTMASTINDDYPVLMFDDFNVVGTEDGVYMKYDDNVNDMWQEPNYDSLDIAYRTGKNFKSLTAADNPKAAMYLYKTNGVTATNSTPVAINVTKNAAVPLHIHQNIGITQETGTEELTVRVGVTFDNSDGTIANGGAPYDWHMFSSALKAAPLGITYQSNVTDAALGGKDYEIYNNIGTLSSTGITPTNYGSRDYMDPPVITWRTDTIGYFPTNTPYGKWGNSGHWPSSGAFSGNSPEDYNSFDFYCLDEPSRHWINFKREGSANFMDHWHQDIDASGNHKNLKYMNEGTLRVGKGYMMGVSKTSMLMADGILNNGTFESEQAVTSTPYNFNMSGYSEELRGFNLVGNPYHSYLDFNALLAANIGNIKGDAYYLFDADAGRYICYPADASDNNKVNAPQFLHPHQGFLVKTDNESCMLTFNNAMRSATADPVSYFREERLNYPLVNLFCHDAAGFYDVTTVEMNRPQLGGGVKLKETRNGNSLIYARLENEDYQTLFAPTGTSTVPVRFEPSQNGVYTLRWDTMHGDFSHLHLIDNLTGADIDLLNQTEYRFEGKVGDYVSRFKLVFEVTDIEEHEQESETNFAFQFGDELVVNGGGELSVFDVQGRHIMTRSLTGAQSSISLPRTAAGLYILRLAGDKQVKIQKLIIK